MIIPTKAWMKSVKPIAVGPFGVTTFYGDHTLEDPDLRRAIL